MEQKTEEITVGSKPVIIKKERKSLTESLSKGDVAADLPREIVRAYSDPMPSDEAPVGGRPRGTVVYATELSLPSFELRSSSGEMKLRTHSKRTERLETLRKMSTSCPTTPPMILNVKDSANNNTLRRGSWATIKKVLGLSQVSAKEYIESLKSNPTEKLDELKSKIDSESSKWITKFIKDEDGVTCLQNFVSDRFSSENDLESEMSLRMDALICLRLLIGKSNDMLKFLLPNKEGESQLLNAIFSNWHFKVLQPQVIGILGEICLKFGYRTSLEILTTFSAKRKRRTKFEELIVYITVAEEPANVALCISYLNIFINSCDDAETRYHMYNELISQGLVAHFSEMKSKGISGEVLQQIELFENGLTDDHEEHMTKRKDSRGMSFSSPSRELHREPSSGTLREREFHRENSGSPMKELISSIQAHSPFIPVQEKSTAFNARIFVWFSNAPTAVNVIIPFDGNTLVKQVKEKIKEKFSNVDFANFGFVYAFSVWLDEEKKLSYYTLDSNEVALEFKERIWMIRIRDSVSKKEDKIGFEPGATIAEVISRTILQFSVSAEEDYGLLVVRKNPADNEWLENTKRINSYKDIQSSVLEFKIKPKLITIKFKDDTTQTLLVDLELTAWKLKGKIAEILGKDSVGNLIDYGLYLEESADNVLLDDNQKLNTYKIKEGTSIRFKFKPYPITVKIVSQNNTLKLNVYWNLRVSDLVQVIAECAGLPIQISYTLMQGTTPVSLLPWMPLRDQKVSRTEEFILKPSENLSASVADEGSIWTDQERSMKPSQIYEIGHLQGFTLNDLVRHLSSDKEYDLEYLKTFLATYQSFTNAEELCRKLFERFRVPPHVPDNARILIQMRVCTIFKHWIEMQSDDLIPVVESIANFIDSEMNIKELSGIVSRLKNTIATISSKTDKAQFYNHLEPPPEPILPKGVVEKLGYLDIDPFEIARALSIQTFDIYCKIRNIEFFNQAWNDPKFQHLAPNLLKIVQKFNYIANAVSTSIITVGTIKNRVKIFEHQLKVAQHLRDLNNFHLLFAYISGFNNSAVLRLKWTRAKLSKRSQSVLEQLEQLCSMEGSFKNARQAFNTAIAPSIPYVGITLVDLTFIDEGNPDLLANNLINFEKRKLVYNILSRIDQFQKISYNFQRVPQIDEFLNNLPTLPEKQLYELSLDCEPRNATKKDIL